MIGIELRQALEQVARRFRQVRLWSGLALCWLTWALVGAGLYCVVSHPGRVFDTGRPVAGDSCAWRSRRRPCFA